MTHVNHERLLVVALLLVAHVAAAQAPSEPPPPDVQEKAFVVLGTHETFAKAREAASNAAGVLGLHLDTRGLTANATTGLTFSREDCRGSDWEYPCYLARGRYDDGVWLSVEFSTAYKGLAPGRFVLIAASGSPTDPLLPVALSRVKQVYPDARLVTAPIYMGCLH